MNQSYRYILGAFLCQLLLPAHAIPVQWELVDVAFDDGATATGSFIFDADLGLGGEYSNISVTTAGGTVFPGNFYDVAITGVTNNTILSLSELERTDYNNTVSTRLFFGTVQAGIPLTNAGGTVPLLLVNTVEDVCNNAACNSRRIPRRGAVSGEVIGTAVPVPAAMWLFASALGLLGWSKRRQVE